MNFFLCKVLGKMLIHLGKGTTKEQAAYSCAFIGHVVFFPFFSLSAVPVGGDGISLAIMWPLLLGLCVVCAVLDVTRKGRAVGVTFPYNNVAN